MRVLFVTQSNSLRADQHIFYLAHPSMAFLLIAVVAAIVLAVASPSGCDALAIFTLELRLGALAVLILAHHVRLVAAIPAIVGEITEPLLRHASVIGTLEVHVEITFRTILRTFVRAVAAVVLSVAEQPLRYASIVRVSRTPLPSGCTILLPAHVRRLVAVISAVVVRIAHPKLGNAFAILTTELSARIAGTII